MFTNLDDLAGGPGGPEASTGEASTADASGDGRATSDGGGSDSSSDGGAGGRFCTTVSGSPLFCEDFDDPTLAASWIPHVDDGGTAGLDDAAAASAPNAIRTTMIPVPSAPCRYAYAAHAFSAGFSKSVRVERDLRLGHAGDNGGFPTMDFATSGIQARGSGANSLCSYYFDISPTSASFVVEPDVDGTKTATYPLTQHFVAGKWTHVAVVIDTPAGMAPTVTVSLDGVTALDKQPITPTLCGFGTLTDVSTGLFCVQGTATDIDVRTDNVAVWTN